MPRRLGFAWDRRRLALETVALLEEVGDDLIENVITHVVPFDEAPAFLKTLHETRPEFLQVVFKGAD